MDYLLQVQFFLTYLKLQTMLNVRSIGYNTYQLTKYEKFDSSNIESKFYLRIRVIDQSGVLSKITSYLNEYNISVEKILQIPDSKEKQYTYFNYNS